jgi:glyoxylase I family protein
MRARAEGSDTPLMTDLPDSLHHVALTVTNLEASRAWYCRLLGADPVIDELRPGLDHMGFSCADRDEVERMQARLADLGIEHGDVAEDHLGYALSFRDPDNIGLEFWAPRS